MATAQQNSKNQHYVWQHYLSAWAAEGSFCCYRQKDKHLFPTQPKSVASETYFYQATKLTDGDLKWLDDFIGRANDERLRELNRDYVKLNQLSFRLREKLSALELHPDARAQIEKELLWAEKNLGEKYHNGIENKNLDLLEFIRSKDDAFYMDTARCGDFLYFISHQYFRTAKMRRSMSQIAEYEQGHDSRRTAGILNHILATNVSMELFRKRRQYRIRFIDNDTAVPYITGDQPIINMQSINGTDDIELYYPLSPRLALILTKDIVKFPNRERMASKFEVERYNYAIYNKSEDQIYSNDQNYLKSLVDIGKNLLSD